MSMQPIESTPMQRGVIATTTSEVHSMCSKLEDCIERQRNRLDEIFGAELPSAPTCAAEKSATELGQLADALNRLGAAIELLGEQNTRLLKL